MPLPLRRAHAAAAVVVAMLGVLCTPGWAHAAAQPQLIVGFHPAAAAEARSTSLARAGVASKRAIAPLDAVVVRAAAGRLEATRRSLLARPDVAWVEVDHVARAYAAVPASPPNDTFFSQQWALARLGAEQAWAHTRGDGVTVAVLDTGVDYIHPDLAGRVELGRDFIDGDDDPMDVAGHGTHVAGIVAAAAGDGFGVAGIAPGVRILAVRVLDADGQGNYSQVADGIVHAADRGARVINLSLGGDRESELLRSAIDYAASRGAIVTCATGNESRTSIGFPARHESCLAVGATDEVDGHAGFSNRGAGIDVVAPGAGILSTVPGATHDAWDGTSMASPYAAGVAALLASQGLGRRQVVDTLLATARDLGPAGPDTTYGAGRIDAAAAVEAGIRTTRATDTTAPTIAGIEFAPQRRTVRRSVALRWKVVQRSGFRRVGTTDYRGRYQYVKVATRGGRRVVDTFRYAHGIVYRRRVHQRRARVVTRTVRVVLPVRVSASDDHGVDRVAVRIDGRIAGVDWSADGGWVVTVPCTSERRQVVVTAWDAADNAGSSTAVPSAPC